MNARFTLDWLSRPPYSDFHPRLIGALGEHGAWPQPEQYDALAGQVPLAAGTELPRFVAQDRGALERLGGYEQHVAGLRAVPTRPHHWHDFFNMTVWAHFPRLRWALNALHVDQSLGPKDPRNGRAPAQNLAATFDESGLLVLSTSVGLLEDLRALRFKQAFWERREELLATTRFWLVGHGMLESLLTPHPGLAAKAMLLELQALPAAGDPDALRFAADAAAARYVHGWRTSHAVLDPIPVLAIPGYCDNGSAAFYDDAQHFPFERRPPRSGSFGRVP